MTARPLTAHADRFARLAVANVTRPYPYQPAHLLTGDDDLAAPREHHPAFYGAYDWHSSVHMHWLMVRLLRRYEGDIDAAAVRAVLDRHLTRSAMEAEAAYLRSHPSFERPYGWAWLVALTAECRTLAAEGGDGARRWADALAPAADAVAGLLLGWLAKATYPVRHGTHANSAFALGLLLDGAAAADLPRVAAPVASALRSWFDGDTAAPVHWEPSGQDFLSPALTEADAMRRILGTDGFARWLDGFLPGLRAGRPDGSAQDFLRPPVVSDTSDPQIGHLIGLSLSRAAALRGIAHGLPERDPRIPALERAAETHLAAGLPHTASGDFTTDHWLATFAVLALDGHVACG